MASETRFTTRARHDSARPLVALGPAARVLVELGPVLVAYWSRLPGECCCSVLQQTVGSGAPMRPTLSIADAVLEELRCSTARAAVRIVRIAASDFLAWERAVDTFGGYEAVTPTSDDAQATTRRGRHAAVPWRATIARVVRERDDECAVIEDFAAIEAWRVLQAVQFP